MSRCQIVTRRGSRTSKGSRQRLGQRAREGRSNAGSFQQVGQVDLPDAAFGTCLDESLAIIGDPSPVGGGKAEEIGFHRGPEVKPFAVRRPGNNPNRTLIVKQRFRFSAPGGNPSDLVALLICDAFAVGRSPGVRSVVIRDLAQGPISES